MKKFKFRLEQILRFRQVVKGEKKRILAEANIALDEAEALMERLKTSLMDISVSTEQTIGVDAFLLADLYANRLKSEITRQAGVIQIRQETVRVALAEYVEASKEVKALETLKDRRQREYAEMVLHEEGKFLDELATQRGNRMRELH